MHANTKAVRAFADHASKFISPKNVKVILELGSRDGLVALDLRERFPNARVFCFECNPDAIRLVRANIAGVSRIELVEKAVCDASGPVDFYSIDPERTITPHADGNIGASSLFIANPDYPSEQYVQNRITVEGVALADWAQERGIDHIDLIWMDLQGAALLALRGMGKLLDRTSIIYTELEYKQMYMGQSLAPEVRSFLEQHDLLLYKKFHQGDWFGDEMFVRRNLLAGRRLITLARSIRNAAGRLSRRIRS